MATPFFSALLSIVNPVLALLGMGLGIGALLAYVSKTFRLESDPVLERINDLLPQTQCGQCGYPGCKPYAEAIASGDAINKCPPGGEKTILNLADLLNLQALPLDQTYGHEEIKKVAFIREAECIGCAKCIPACPVDAILGAPKFMHTVIESECTGCDLCIDPCPVDCIDLIEVAQIFSPVSKAINDEEFLACINCGLCIDECPVDILPHELYWACRGGELEQAESLNLMHCIECGKCDKICPSLIPLVAFYQTSKQELKSQQQDKKLAEKAKQRFENHQKRMEKLATKEEQRRNKRAELAKQNRQQTSSESIKAALERVKARKK
jgi:Na+-translocating ferredoxin:NAD+ oxidoreductase subunit B